MIKTKRNSLELFLREQMLGPGACMKHFVLRQHDGTITGLDSEEVLNTTPGSVYSTGILFPQRIDKTTQTGLAQKLNKSIDENVSANAIEENDNDGEGLEEILNRSQSDEEDVFSLSQRFPTTIGISCCLDKVGLFNNYDIKITVSGRYYWKIPKSDYTNIIIRVSDAPSFDILFSRFKEKLSSYFVFNEDGLSLRHDIEKEGASIKDSLLEINQLFCKEVAQKENGSLDEEYLAIGDSYRYLKSYKERLWRKLRFVKDGITISEEERNDVLKTIEKIENYETFLSYFDDALSICSAKSFGYWISDTFCKTVDLSDVDLNSSGSKIIFSPRKIGSLKDIVCYDIDGSGTTASLSLWVQVMNGLNESSGKKYLKIQVENTSSPFEEDESHYFSIVTEKVNQRSFFGIEVKIESPWLCPYQDHFSREIQGDIEQLNYLYRSLEDYGIGHLCSVNWKVTNDEKWVKSEFLPSYETPDVEAVPRDKQSFIFDKGKYIPKPLLSSDKPLQFKW
ncbi:MAG: helicase, partial [Bacteroidales bacterium]